MIKQHENGYFSQNTWIYINTDTKEAIIVDPGDELETLYDLIGDCTPTHIFITHGHMDHIQGLEDTKKQYPDAIIVAHELSNETLPDPKKNLSYMTGVDVIAPKPDWTYKGDDATIEAGGQKWILVHTPGHAMDHTIFIGEDGTLFGGDVIFERGGMGRVDFPGCDPMAMRVSIAKTLSAPETCIVYAGHGSTFTIAEAKPYFRNLQV